ncbi:MAG: Mediator of RNA polymerase II transcription subunit 6 [Trizodia sp. TS-e1964]|nr:MAG: Mediator of RNA polymerase II transcription subunit 6 [Trizodia sp. TS-e1964]
MNTTSELPLDEIQWRSPQLAQAIGGIHTNTVLPYFSQSPFFDVTSNNAILTTQATYNPSMQYILQTRKAFEDRLSTMQGTEFVVAHEPILPTPAEFRDSVSQETGESKGIPRKNNSQPSQMMAQAPNGDYSGVWVIRKQIRKKRPNSEDAVTTLGTYFVIGENIYMAPSVGNVIGSRLLSAVTCLTSFLSIASALPTFSPSHGHTYKLPQRKSQALSLASQLSQQSKEDTPSPDVFGRSANKSTANDVNSLMPAEFSMKDTLALAQTFSYSLRYGEEYVDDNPLVGEPGSIILSSTRGIVPSARDALSGNKANPPTKAASSSAPESQPKAGGRKGSKGLAKRLTSPTSPTSPTVPPKPKRRKSKAAGLSANSPT